MLGRKIARDFESDSTFGRPLSQQPIRVAENVQPFFGSDPGEITDYEIIRSDARAFFSKPSKLMPSGTTCILLSGMPRSSAHPLCIEIAHRKKAIDELDVRSNQFQRLASIRLAQAVDEQVFALQRAKDRNVQLSFYWLGKRDQQRVRQVHHIEPRFILEPVDQVVISFR